MERKEFTIGITQGDINGIGYEIIIKTLMDQRVQDNCCIVVYGSPKVAAYHRKAIDASNFSFNIITKPEDAIHHRPNIIDCNDDSVKVELGQSTSIAGIAAFQALEKATDDLLEGKLDALVTAPINKESIQSKSFDFPGHTEYFSYRLKGATPLMLMVHNNLRVGVVTGHIPVNDICAVISENKILEKLQIMNRSLQYDFNIRKPKIAVMGLNPHAGDHGVIGSEEKEIIQPAINRANDQNILAVGPFPADGFFGSSNYTKFDAILAMYHDQGLIPFKSFAFDEGVNFTAGLPIIRTSPGHGTAYNLAGQGEASEASFRNSLYLALDVLKNRKMNDQASQNPMKNVDLDRFNQEKSFHDSELEGLQD